MNVMEHFKDENISFNRFCKESSLNSKNWYFITCFKTENCIFFFFWFIRHLEAFFAILESDMEICFKKFY